jgi:hypothetical protein
VQAQGPIVRPAQASDLSYIRNSWCRSSHSHLESAHYLSKQGPAPHYHIYRTLFDDVQDRILSGARVLVAVNDDDTDQILGFLVYEPAADAPPVLHYLQTKKELWRTGIGKVLLEAAGISTDQPCVYTFSSPIFSKVRPPERWSHVPHWLTKGSL